MKSCNMSGCSKRAVKGALFCKSCSVEIKQSNAVYRDGKDDGGAMLWFIFICLMIFFLICFYGLWSIGGI